MDLLACQRPGRYRGGYVDGREDGPWTSWDEDGTKEEEDRYVAGEKAGRRDSSEPV